MKPVFVCASCTSTTFSKAHAKSCSENDMKWHELQDQKSRQGTKTCQISLQPSFPSSFSPTFLLLKMEYQMLCQTEGADESLGGFMPV